MCCIVDISCAEYRVTHMIWVIECARDLQRDGKMQKHKNEKEWTLGMDYPNDFVHVVGTIVLAW